MDDRSIIKDAHDVTQAKAGVGVRYVLIFGLALVVAAFIATTVFHVW